MQCGLRLAGSSDVELNILVAITKALSLETGRNGETSEFCLRLLSALYPFACYAANTVAIYLQSQLHAIHL